MKDPKKVREAILDVVDLTTVMLSYGVDFVYSPQGLPEVQFRCPFHGKDDKPSARLYKETKSCYCWVCRKKWDVVSFIQEMEQKRYSEVISFIINKYHVDLSRIPDEPDIASSPDPEISDVNVTLIRFQKNLRELRGRLPFEKYNPLCTALFMIRYYQKRGMDISESAKNLEDKLEKTCQSLS